MRSLTVEVDKFDWQKFDLSPLPRLKKFEIYYEKDEEIKIKKDAKLEFTNSPEDLDVLTFNLIN